MRLKYFSLLIVSASAKIVTHTQSSGSNVANQDLPGYISTGFEDQEMLTTEIPSLTTADPEVIDEMFEHPGRFGNPRFNPRTAEGAAQHRALQFNPNSPRVSFNPFDFGAICAGLPRAEVSECYRNAFKDFFESLNDGVEVETPGIYGRSGPVKSSSIKPEATPSPLRKIIDLKQCEGTSLCDDLEAECYLNPDDNYQPMCVCHNNLQWNSELNTCEGCRTTDDSFTEIVNTILTPNNARVASTEMLQKFKNKEIGDCNDDSRAYPHNHKCRIACKNGFLPKPLEAGEAQVGGIKFMKCSCNKAGCAWRYGGKFIKKDEFGNKLPEEDWTTSGKYLQCYDHNDPEMFAEEIAERNEKFAKIQERVEKRAQKAQDKEDRLSEREAKIQNAETVFEAKREARKNPLGITMMHAFKVPYIDSFYTDYIQRKVGFNQIFGATPIYIIPGFRSEMFADCLQFLDRLIDYLKTKGIPLSYHTTAATGPSNENAKFTVFLYNPHVVRIISTFPLEGEVDPETWQHYPVGAMFERINRKEGWIRRFTLLSYSPPADTRLVKTEIPALKSFLSDNSDIFGNNTMIYGDFRFDCLDYFPADGAISQGMTNGETDAIIQELSEVARFSAYTSSKLKQPGFRRKNFCTRYGTFILNGRKGEDMCDETEQMYWGKISQNVLLRLGQNAIPLQCSVN